MTDLPRAQHIARAGDWSAETAADTVVLGYRGRVLRQGNMTGTGGLAFRADLPAAAPLGPGDALVLDDGRHVLIEAAVEPLVAVTGDLPRLAWALGRRGLPCLFADDRLLVRREDVPQADLAALGAILAETEGRFVPEAPPPGSDPAGHAAVRHKTYHHHLSEDDPEPPEVEA